MGHNKNQNDAEAVVARYRKVTGDYNAALVRNGNHYFVRTDRSSARRLNYYGAGAFCQVVNAYCDGFEDREGRGAG